MSTVSLAPQQLTLQRLCGATGEAEHICTLFSLNFGKSLVSVAIGFIKAYYTTLGAFVAITGCEGQTLVIRSK